MKSDVSFNLTIKQKASFFTYLRDYSNNNNSDSDSDIANDNDSNGESDNDSDSDNNSDSDSDSDIYNDNKGDGTKNTCRQHKPSTQGNLNHMTESDLKLEGYVKHMITLGLEPGTIAFT